MVTITVDAGDIYNHISLSKDLSHSTTILTESSTVRGYFVGEMGDWLRDKEGDKVDLVVNGGKVMLAYSTAQDGGDPLLSERSPLRGWGLGIK
jgi:hypothetical protein